MLVPRRFANRRQAGVELAARVLEFTSPPTVVLGIPRGGVAVAAPVAELLGASLCAVWVRKLVLSREPEVTFGAVDLDGDATLAAEIVRAEAISGEEVAELAYDAHQRLLAEWERMPGLDPSSLLPGATAVIVDDAMHTGVTLRAAMRWARRQFVRAVVLCVPVVDRRIWHRVAGDADRAITLEELDLGPLSRGDIYEDFKRISDGDIQQLLQAATVYDASP